MKKKSILIKKIKYEENSIFILQYNHPMCKECLHYSANIQIKETGQNPIEIKLKFNDIYPDMAPMPPHEHTIKAESISELYSKLNRWTKKYGYILK